MTAGAGLEDLSTRTMVDTSHSSSSSSAFLNDQEAGDEDPRAKILCDDTSHASGCTPTGVRNQWRLGSGGGSGGRTIRDAGGVDPGREELILYKRARVKWKTIDTEGEECTGGRGSENVRDIINVDDDSDGAFDDEISCCTGGQLASTPRGTRPTETGSRNGDGVKCCEVTGNGDWNKSERMGNRKMVSDSTSGFGGSVGRISGSDGKVCAAKWKIGGSDERIRGKDEKIGYVNKKLGGSLKMGGSDGKIGYFNKRLGSSFRKIGGSDGKIGGSAGKIGGSAGKIGGSDGKIVDSDGKIGGSLRKIRGSDGKIGGSDGKIGGSDGKIVDSDDKIVDSDGKIRGSDKKPEGCEWNLGGGGRTSTWFLQDREDSGGDNSIGSGGPGQGSTPAAVAAGGGDTVSHDDFARPPGSSRRKMSLGIELEGMIKKAHAHKPSGVGKLSRAKSFTAATRTKPPPPLAAAAAPADSSRLRRLIARWSLPKSNSVFTSFGNFLASYMVRAPWKRASDPTPGTRVEDEEGEGWGRDKERMKLEEDVSEDPEYLVSTETLARVDEVKVHEEGEEEAGARPIADGASDNDKISETDKLTSDAKRECESQVDEEDNEVFLDVDEARCAEDTKEQDSEDSDSEDSEDDETFRRNQNWVKKRVSQIERQISLRKQAQLCKELARRKSNDSILSRERGGSVESTGNLSAYLASLDEGAERRDKTSENEGCKVSSGEARRDSDATVKADSSVEDDSDTEVEEDEVEGTVTLRSKYQDQTTHMYRYSTRLPSLYRYSAVRPRTVIIGLGVCTETQLFSESFGDGVSETESEEDDDDGGPTTPHTTPTTPRAPSPSRTSRPHSPLSDMDTESKRNSQAVSTEPSDLEDHSSVTTSDLDSCHDLAALDARKDKAYRIAHELLHTERTYVKVLHLIDQEFQFRVDHENRAHHMFPHDVIPHMFSNVKSIYKLHHDFLLPQLEERMAQWERNRRIGDIMKSFAPFLKMYTEYVRNFDNAMTLINQWQSKCPRFAAIMDEIHSMEVCGNLTLQHHMLSPVQRIPRYEMLLRDYLKKLPEDSPDRHDTEQALHLVSTAANHANDAMKKIDKFEKLLEIQESLGGAEDLVSPTRELIKEGKIIKISARSGDHQERYIFLLTDLLLLCSPRRMGGRVMSGPQYRLRAKYHVENLIVQEGDNLETANTFYIKDNNKSVELYTQTLEEKELWLEAFIRAIHETSQRKSSLKLHFNPDQRIVDVDLGQKQPMLIRSDSVNKCMECASQFTMVRRKHHCRACGAVVCNKCSSFKASLAYESGKSVRVCRTCHATLQELSSSTATPSPEIDEADECSLYSAKEPPDLPFRNRGVLEVSAKTGGAVMQGFLQLKTHRKTWVKRWFALHTDFVLYSFKCEADEQALTATPVPGFTVTHLQGTRNESGISDKEKERAFKLHHAKKHYIFQAASKEESQRWIVALKKASQAELPSPVQ